jgi:hypothetical protein
MKLNVEVCLSGRGGNWVWRVRSTDNRNGDTMLALGLSKSEEDAWRRGRLVQGLLAPHFTEEYRAATPLPGEGEG